MDFPFARTLGQASAKQALLTAFESRRFPHALLLHGAPGVGQAALALDTAQLLLCESRHEKACGRCPACVAFNAQSLENLYHLLPLKKGGKDSDGEGLDAAAMDEYIEQKQHLLRDPYTYVWPEKAGISIQQVRELQRQLLYAESRGRARVVLLLWLEALRPEAANALLKTLEEPPKDTYFVITSEDRAGLMPTLLSRCLHIALPPMGDAELQEALRQNPARLPGGPKPALVPLAEGSPGAYFSLHEHGETRLEATTRFLAAALELDTSAFIDHVETSESLADFESTAQILEMALRLVRLEQARRVSALGDSAGSPHAMPTFDPTLAAALMPLARCTTLAAFAAYLEDTLKAVRGYVKPQNAVIGLFLDYEQKGN
jgi:DNA polymerase III, delta subunit